MRARLRGGWDPEIERVYGRTAPTTKLAARFAKNNDTGDDATVLVPLAADGTVLGNAWPVFRGQVSLDAGFPDMKEEEAASLLLSARCRDQLFALRDHGVRPAAATPIATTGGCAHCSATTTSEARPLDVAVLVALAGVFLLRWKKVGAMSALSRRGSRAAR